MAEYILIVLVTFVIIYALVKGCHVNINISYKQEFSAEDRQLLEDLYNDKGDLKSKDSEIPESLDEVIRSIQEAMLLDDEEGVNE